MLITCEHATNCVPALYREAFVGCHALLSSHKGIDIGALSLAKMVARTLQAPLIIGSISRLVVDLNRSVGNPTLFSPQVKQLGEASQHVILEKYYFPYRKSVFEKAVQLMREDTLLHLSIHSFTPIFQGKRRKVDLGLLYDPHRKQEVNFCKNVRVRFCAQSDLRCYMNLPYRGTSDGLVTDFRKRFPEEKYIGIEIEMNQKFALHDKRFYSKSFLKPLISSIAFAIKEG